MLASAGITSRRMNARSTFSNCSKSAALTMATAPFWLAVRGYADSATRTYPLGSRLTPAAGRGPA